MKKTYTSPTVEIEKFTVTNIQTYVSGLGGTDIEEDINSRSLKNEF